MEKSDNKSMETKGEAAEKNAPGLLEEEYAENTDEEKKKTKNLISLAILLLGLFLGSLFVDIGQLVRGGGYSQKNLNKSDIFEAGGKTWVAYSEPTVPVAVVSDDNCQECDPTEVIIWLRRVLPTVSTEKVSFDSEEGKKIISESNVKTLPAFIFDQDVDKTDLYAQASDLFELKNAKYVLNTQMLGLPAGRYLEIPEINENDAVFGASDAKVKVVVFSDFQCPYCKLAYSVLRDTMKNYEDRVSFVFKELPLDIHPQANAASLAGGCALEQNKFWEYADNLYARQSEWGSAKDTANFKAYARTLGLDNQKFSECLDNQKYQSKIDADKKLASEFGISGTPTIFINDQVESGAITAEQLKAGIEEELNK